VSEYRFCERRFRFDWAWPEQKVALEMEGGVWTRGRHTRPQGYERDCEKYSLAAILGWRVIRVTPRMLEDGRALELLLLALTKTTGGGDSGMDSLAPRTGASPQDA